MRWGLVDSPGIEPGFHPCEGYVLPFNYEPNEFAVLSHSYYSIANLSLTALGLEGERVKGCLGRLAESLLPAELTGD